MEGMTVAPEGVMKSALPAPQPSRAGCLGCGPKISSAAVISLLFAAIACAIAPMFGTDNGWALWYNGHYEADGSPYTNLLKMVVIDHPETGIDPADLNVLNRFLPKVSSAITLKQGWLLSVSYIQLHIEEAKPVSKFIRHTARGIVPESMHEDLENILGKGQDSVDKPYEGERLAARYTGALAIAVLGISVILALTILVIWACKGIDGPARYLLRKGWVVASAVYSAIIIEYVILAVGAHRAMKDSPVTQKGHIPRPDWAWILAACAAVCWSIISALNRHQNAAEPASKKSPVSVDKKESWNIPVNYERSEGGIEVV